MAQSNAVVSPNLGLRFDKPAIAIDPRELQDGQNFRVKEGKLTNLNLGWTQFNGFTLDGPVRLIANFFIRGGSEQLVFGTQKDLYRLTSTGGVAFITPVVVAGTVAATGAPSAGVVTVIGTGTNWVTAGVKIGDAITFGTASGNDPAATWYPILSVASGQVTITATGTHLTASGATYTIRRRFTGDADDIWSHDTFVNAGGVEDRIYLTNGIEPLIKWNGTDTFATSLDTFTYKKIKCLAAVNNMMLYGNYEVSSVSYPTSIANSDPGDPESFVGLAEEFVVHGEPDPILAVRPLADYIAIYSKRVITVAQFVGDPIVFVFRTVANGIGPLGPNLIADFGDYHLFAGYDAQYRFDGATVNTDGEHVWREIIRRNDPVRRLSGFTLFDEENGDLIWSLPLTTDAGNGTTGATGEQAFLLHYLESVEPTAPQPYGHRSFPFTAGGYYQRSTGLTWADLTAAWSTQTFRWNDQAFSVAFPIVLAGTFEGKVYTLNTQQNTASGGALPSYVTFGRKATADGKVRGMVKRVYPFAEAFSNDLDVTVAMADHAMGDATITDTQPFDQSLPEGGHFTSHFRRGRFFDTKFGTAGPSEPYVLAGYDIDVVVGGER